MYLPLPGEGEVHAPAAAGAERARSPPRNAPCRATSNKVKVAVSISLMGDAASRENPVKARRRSKGRSSVFRRTNVVEPMVTLSPMSNSFRPSIFRPLTYTPDLEPVSQMNQPSSRRSSTAWSREAVASGR